MDIIQMDQKNSHSTSSSKPCMQCRNDSTCFEKQFEKALYQSQKKQGFQVTTIERDSALIVKGSEILRNGKIISDENYQNAILKADNLNRSEFSTLYEKIEQGDVVNDSVLASFHRTAIENFYRQEVTPELIKLDDRGRFRKKIKLFSSTKSSETLHGPEPELDKVQSQYVSVLTDPHYQDRFLFDAFISAGILIDQEFQTDVIITSSTLKDFSKFVHARKPQYESIFNSPVRSDILSKPVSQLGTMLGKVGLSTKKLPVKYQGKQKIYSYQIDAKKLDQMLKIFELRQKSK